MGTLKYKNNTSYILLVIFLFLGISQLKAQQKTNPPFWSYINDSWVDSMLNSMSDDEKIGQLFMVPAYSNKDDKHIKSINKLIKDYKIGGLIMMQGGPIRHANLVNLLQKNSEIPLLVSIDGEWGVSMRLDSCISYPRQMMLGAIRDDKIIYNFGNQVAKECKLLGIHVNFAPVIDVNNNRLNPVINHRSFGEDKVNVSLKGIAYMKGLQENKILAVGKHFPGHGDTETDSHKSLPIINHSIERLDSIELYPFKTLINSGLGSIMVAHLFIPAYDKTENQASTLSKPIVSDLLKNKLGFKGIIFTDALNMKGVSSYNKAGVIEAKSLLAGNDILLFSENVPAAIKEIKKLIDNNQITMDEISEKCRKILAVKRWTGAQNTKQIDTKQLYSELNSPEALLIKRSIVENAITLVKNENTIIPIQNLDQIKFASIVFGADSGNIYQNTMNLYYESPKFMAKKDLTNAESDAFIEMLSKYDVVSVSIHGTNRVPKNNFGVSPQFIEFTEKLAKRTKVILNIFASPYALDNFNSFENIPAIIVSYEDTYETNHISAQMIFGGYPIKGKLPTSVKSFKYGTGEVIDNTIRLRYSIPEEAGMRSDVLKEIDYIMNDAIKQGAMPGGQVLVARNGIVVFQKSFGYFTYDSIRPVYNEDIYDLASVTKVASTTTALMKLYDEKKYTLNDTLANYLSVLDSTNKREITIDNILTHQAQLAPWIPYHYRLVNKDKTWKSELLSNNITSKHTVKVADSVFMIGSYRDSILSYIIKSPLSEKKEYKYSDLGFYLMHSFVEKISSNSIDDYMSNNFYKPLGAFTLGYKPIEKFEKERIAPTEFDARFRKQQIQGFVHDPGAAMLGGVSGHAGLFSNANDLAKLMQMILQGGIYGGKRYISKETINLFTSSYFWNQKNRRGLGWDKPQPDFSQASPVCRCVSNLSYGHTGFTGTMVWNDPSDNLVYIFLSNRVFPDQENKKLIRMEVRQKIQKVISISMKNEVLEAKR